MNFGQFARSKRKAAKLTQDDVAKALGLNHRSAISKKETGQWEWSLADVVRLSESLGVPASQLIAEWESKWQKSES